MSFDICYIADENYVLPTKVSINSICQNCGESKFFVHVVAVDVCEKSRASMKALESENVKIEVLPFSNEYAGLGLDHAYVSKAALFKFQIPNIFSSLDKILYLDGDTVLYPEFAKIFGYDISQKYAAVCPDMLAMLFEKWHEKIGREKYFNSGVMLLNLKKMREDEIPRKLAEYKKNDKDRHFMDQNAFNAVIGGNVLWLPPKFNLMSTYTTIKKIYGRDIALPQIADFFAVSEGEMQSCMENPAILHVTNCDKVWKTMSAPKFDEWAEFIGKNEEFEVAKSWLKTVFLELQKKDELREMIVDVKNHTFWGFCVRVWRKIKRTAQSIRNRRPQRLQQKKAARREIYE